MRRNARALTVALTVCCGCQKPAGQMPIDNQDVYAGAEADLFAVDPAGSTAGPSEPDTYESAGGHDSAGAYGGPATDTAPPARAAAPASRTHKVVKGDTLYALARRYYRVEGRWKDIYEANRDRLSDPDFLRIDQVLIIP